MKRYLLIVLLFEFIQTISFAQQSTYVYDANYYKTVDRTSNLESLPGAPNVLYLDIYTLSSGTIADKLDDIVRYWIEIAEDYRPFNVNVTTRKDVFDATPIFNKIRYTVDYADGGGACYMNSFGTGNTDMNSCRGGLSAASHELGHSLGLAHSDGTINSSVFSVGTYYNGNSLWASIMGCCYNSDYLTFSNGDYPGASNKDDQILIMGNKLNYRADDVSNTMTLSKAIVVINSDSVSPVLNNGIIETRNDIDFYSFTIPTGGGDIDLRILPLKDKNNLHVSAILLDQNGIELLPGEPIYHDLRKRVKQGVQLKYSFISGGTYYLKVQNSGYVGSNNDGYSNYGSLGYYEISGRLGYIQPIVDFTVPKFQCLSGGSIKLNNLSRGSNLTYSWKFQGADIQTSNVFSPTISYNSSGVFSIELTVSNDAGSSKMEKIIEIGNVPFRYSFLKTEFDSLKMITSIKNTTTTYVSEYSLQKKDFKNNKDSLSYNGCLVAENCYSFKVDYPFSNFEKCNNVFNWNPYRTYSTANENVFFEGMIYYNKWYSGPGTLPNIGDPWVLVGACSDLISNAVFQLKNLNANTNFIEVLHKDLGVSTSYQSSFCVPKIDLSTGIDDNIIQSDVNIYPNPTSADITILSSLLKIASISITNTLGSEVYSNTSVNENTTNVVLSSLSNGVYFFNIKLVNGQNIVKKLLKY